jgi:glyoxylase-like metal-dependent hydrolase (beta-lactamase superfamily II)
MPLRRWIAVAAVCATGWFSVPATRAQGSATPVEVLQVRPNFFLIGGAGGNVAVQVGADGALVVNSGSAESADALLGAIQRATSQPIRLIITTSADADFVGGNGRLSRAGRSILTAADRRVRPADSAEFDPDAAGIIAHGNVLTRMSAPTGETPPFPKDTWPTEAFGERRRALYFNDEGIEILHVPAAHTDGDTIVFFRRSDVVVAGAIVDATRFPVIDVERGGSIQGEIAALNRIIELAITPGPYIGTPSGGSATSPQPGGTEVITARGRVYRQIDVVNYRDMVVYVRDTVQDLIGRKLTLDQVKAAQPAKAFAAFGGANDFVEAVYRSLTR